MANNLTPEQQALFDSIMGNSSQMKNLNPVIEIPKPEEVLSSDEQDLYNSIMGKSVQMQNYNPMAALGDIAPVASTGRATSSPQTASAFSSAPTTVQTTPAFSSGAGPAQTAPAFSSGAAPVQTAPAPAAPAMDSGKKLSQSEIDALIASMVG